MRIGFSEKSRSCRAPHVNNKIGTDKIHQEKRRYFGRDQVACCSFRDKGPCCHFPREELAVQNGSELSNSCKMNSERNSITKGQI